ncbi:hypothetical protein AURANDRAFT_8035, partial [Aureococcus anophagefferens]
ELFIKACRGGLTSIVVRYIDEGQEVDAQDATQCTGLHYAAANGHVDVVRVLIGANASLEARDANKESPLIAACHRGECHGVSVLLAHGA